MNKTANRCLNCGTQAKGNFCSYCGQSTKTGRIKSSVVFDEMQHNFLHLHRGLLFTLRSLLVVPQQVIEGYIAGKRKKYISPIQYLFVGAAFYSLVLHFFGVYPDSEVVAPQLSGNETNLIYRFYYNYYSLWLVVTLPVSAFSSFLFFRKHHYNYMEHLVMYAYITGTAIYILLLTYPIFYLTHSVLVYILIHSIAFIYNVIVLTVLFNTTCWLKAVIKATFSIFLVTLLVTLLAAVLIKTYQNYN